MKTISLLFNTVRLVGNNNNSVGTGFFFELTKEVTAKEVTAKEELFIITNTHVIANQDQVNCVVFKSTSDRRPSSETVAFTFNLKEPDTLYTHPSEDVAAIRFSKGVTQERECHVFLKAFQESDIKEDKDLAYLKAVEDVLMVGYPRNLYDVKNNFPLIRRGITSSHPAIDHNGKPQGVVDGAVCLGGSSGSPIFLTGKGMYETSSGSIAVGFIFAFLGLLCSAPQSTDNGLIIAPISVDPTSAKVETFTKIGYYVKAKTLLWFKEQI